MSQELIGNRNQPACSPEALQVSDLALEEVFGSSQQLPKSSEIRRREPSSRSTSSEDSQNSEAKLKDLLVIHSVVSTASSFAEKHQVAISTKASFRGRGTCGTVFERPGTTFALKLARTDSDALWNDYKMHMRVFSEFNGLGWISSEVHVPRCHWFANANDDEWWSENLEKFPKDYQSRNNVMCCERILPRPQEKLWLTSTLLLTLEPK
jgi:hypothetical protein